MKPLNAHTVIDALTFCLLAPDHAERLTKALADETDDRDDAEIAAEHGVVLVSSVTATFGLDPAAVDRQRSQIADWLLQLPPAFRQYSGGGWSFLNGCQRADESIWTGLHKAVEALFVLAVAADLGRYLALGKSDHLPAAVPYFTIYDGRCREALGQTETT